MNNNKSFLILSKTLFFAMIYMICISLLHAGSRYEEPFTIPPYDPHNATHLLITPSNGKWRSELLNSSAYQHFYITPGAYHTKINLTASGTRDKRRTLSLYNGNDKHPAALPDTQVADVRLYFKGASYWIVDRMAILDTTLPYVVHIQDNATHNIINRLHAKNYTYGIVILPFCHYNTVQNSYMNHMTHAGRMSDDVAIALASSNIVGTRTEGTKIINNDIRNANDGIQLVVSAALTANDVSYPGTIIDSNRIWMDGDVYTNGDYAVHGYNPNGAYMIGENALDLKTGSDDPKQPILITNNIMWGYQRVDTTPQGSYSGGSGQAIVVHYGVYNMKINNNIVTHSQRALGIAALEEGGPPYSARYGEITHNIFHNLNTVNPEDDRTYGMYIYNSTEVRIANNTFVDIALNSQGQGYFFNYENTTESPFVNNVIINTSGSRSSFGNRVDNNFYYNTHNIRFDETNKHLFSDSKEANMGDYTFAYERFTNHQKYKTLKGVLTTKTSPHATKAGSSIGLDNLMKESKGVSIIMFLLE